MGGRIVISARASRRSRSIELLTNLPQKICFQAAKTRFAEQILAQHDTYVMLSKNFFSKDQYVGATNRSIQDSCKYVSPIILVSIVRRNFLHAVASVLI